MLQSPRAHQQQALSPRELSYEPATPMARPPSQRQMLEMAFEGETLDQPRELDPVGLDGEVLSPRDGSAHSSRDAQYSQQPRYALPPHVMRLSGPGSARSSVGSWHELSGVMVPTTPSYALLHPAVPHIEDDSSLIERENPELFQAGILEHARRLGIDPQTEPDLMWIARDSLVAQLPEGWTSEEASGTQEPYYYNHETGESRWDHPLDDHFRQLVENYKRRQSYSGGSQRFSSGEDMHTASYYEQQRGYTDGGMAAAWHDDYSGSAVRLSYGGSEYQHGDQWSATPDHDQAHEYYHHGYDVNSTSVTGSSSKGYEDYSESDVADSHSTLISSGRPQYTRGGGATSPVLAEMEAMKTRIEELESKNKELEDQRNEDDALILKLETQMKVLMGQVEESEKYRLAEAEKSKDELELRETAENLRATLEESERRLKEVEFSKKSMEKDLELLQHDRSQEVNNGSETADLLNEIMELRQSVNQEKSRREKLEEEYASYQELQAASAKELNTARAIIKKLEGDLSRLSKKEQDDSRAATDAAAGAAKALAMAEQRANDAAAQLAVSDREQQASRAEAELLRKEVDALKIEHATRVEAVRVELGTKLEARDKESEAATQQLAAANDAVRSALSEKVALEIKLEQQVKLAAMQQTEFEDQQRALKRDIRALERDIKSLQSVSKEREDEFAATKRIMASLEQKLQEQDLIVEAARRAAHEDAEKAAAEIIRQANIEKARIADLYAQELQTRRKLHNRLMELQGNIRVFCRVRPIQAVELKSEQSSPAVFFRENDPESLDLVVGGELGSDGKLLNGAGQKHQFEFDHVFQPSSSQEQVFEQTKALVTSALDGFNVCIFAYGQTGSGKTHTMEGTEVDRGVNFRALEELFKIREERAAVGNFECTMKLSMLEVYNETVVDLLDRSQPSSGVDQRKGLEIRIGKQGVYVENLIDVEVFNEKDVTDLMSLGKSHRSVGAHDFNEHSSRSHLVLSITIETFQKTENRRRSSKLHLIDLAGSERVSKTAASGQRLKEAQNINRSLSALGDVIAALGSSSKHVPYRNSKLTFLLQESLSGNSKVLMFVNVSPVQWNAWETLCSLNFASRCRNVALGVAKANDSASLSLNKEPSRSTTGITTTPSGKQRPPAPSPSVKGAQRVVYG